MHELLQRDHQRLLLYLMARDRHLSAGTIGLILSVASLGGLAGALLASKVGTWIGTATGDVAGCRRSPRRSG